MISEFRYKYRFLSNFYPCTVVWKNHVFPSVEHAYQTAKACNGRDAIKIMTAATPGQAKKIARTVQIRADWDDIKLGIMEELLREKFRDKDLAQMLMDTGTEILVEGNNWGDTYWGVCRGEGRNHLGKLLMKIREEL